MTFEKTGYAVIAALLDKEECDRLIRALPPVSGSGSRTLLEREPFRRLVHTLRVSRELLQLVGDRVAVQCTLFQKSDDCNWSVRLHRDSIIPVCGDGPWQSAGQKEGMSAARPPREVLDDCVAVRVHLDGAPIEDVSVVPGSHRNSARHRREDAVPIPVPRGGALVMCPSLLHASSKLDTTRNRRVLHYLFAPGTLPHGYRWYYSI